MKSCATASLLLVLLAGTAYAQTAPTMPTTAAVAAPAPTPLPDVAVPTMPAEAPAADAPTADAAPPAAADANALPATPAAPAEPTITESPSTAVEEAPYSFGDVPFSLFYSPEQADKMRKVLTAYEAAKRHSSNAPIEVVEEALDIAPAVTIDEPPLYPTFTLRSIVYRDPSDWTVWIGDKRITPRVNTPDQELRVLGLTPNSGRFLWRPAYATALVQRKAQNAFADSKSVAHKLTKPNGAQLDATTGEVVFTLRQNQTFVPAYMATFEGKVPSTSLPSVGVPGEDDKPATNAPVDPNAPTPAATSGAPAQQPTTGLNPSTSLQQLYQKANQGGPMNETQTLDTLLKTQQNMQKFAPPGAQQPAQ